MTGGRVVVLGTDRTELRGRHERRHRLRARRDRRRSRAAATARWSISSRSTSSRTSSWCSSLIQRHVEYTGSELGARVLRRLGRSVRRRSSRSCRATTSACSQAQARAAAAGRDASFIELVGVARQWVRSPGSSRSRARSRRRGRSRSALHDWREVYLPYPEAALEGPGRALHGLRHPVLPPGLSAREPDPRLERSRLPRSLAGGHRSAARDQQLSRSSPAGCARRRARARACSASTTTRSRSRRSRSRSSTARSTKAGSTARPPEARTGKRVAVVGSGPAGLAAADAAEPRRPLRSPSSSAPTASAACCATASPSSSWRSGSSIGGSQLLTRGRRRVPDRASTSASTCRSTSCAREFDAIVLAGGATRPRDLPVPGPRARRASTSRWST